MEGRSIPEPERELFPPEQEIYTRIRGVMDLQRQHVIDEAEADRVIDDLLDLLQGYRIIGDTVIREASDG
jgi:hypothetical protein